MPIFGYSSHQPCKRVTINSVRAPLEVKDCVLSITQASATRSGYLSAADYQAFSANATANQTAAGTIAPYTQVADSANTAIISGFNQTGTPVAFSNTPAGSIAVLVDGYYIVTATATFAADDTTALRRLAIALGTEVKQQTGVASPTEPLTLTLTVQGRLSPGQNITVSAPVAAGGDVTQVFGSISIARLH